MRCEALGGVPYKAALDEVDEGWVVAVDELGDGGGACGKGGEWAEAGEGGDSGGGEKERGGRRQPWGPLFHPPEENSPQHGFHGMRLHRAGLNGTAASQPLSTKHAAMTLRPRQHTELTEPYHCA